MKAHLDMYEIQHTEAMRGYSKHPNALWPPAVGPATLTCTLVWLVCQGGDLFNLVRVLCLTPKAEWTHKI